MRSGRFFSIAIATACGIFGVAVAQAGDKIQFSASSVPLTVPHVDQPAVDSDDLALKFNAADQFSQEPPQVYQSYVAVRPKRSVDSSDRLDSRDARDSRDGQDSYDSSPDDERYAPRARFSRTETNTWDDQRSIGRNNDRSMYYRAPEVTEGLNRPQNSARQGWSYDANPSAMASGLRENPDSVHSMLHDQATGLPSLRPQVNPFYDEMKANNDSLHSAYTSDRLYAPEDARPRGPSAFSATEINTAPAAFGDDRLRDRAQAEDRTARIAHAEETIMRVNPENRYGPVEPPASPPGYVQARPAVLPFPKKPGSVFQ